MHYFFFKLRTKKFFMQYYLFFCCPGFTKILTVNKISRRYKKKNIFNKSLSLYCLECIINQVVARSLAIVTIKQNKSQHKGVKFLSNLDLFFFGFILSSSFIFYTKILYPFTVLNP